MSQETRDRHASDEVSPERTTTAQDSALGDPIGEILLSLGAVSAERLRDALSEQQKRPGVRIGQLLDVDEVSLSRALARQHGLPWIEEIPEPSTELLSCIPEDLLEAAAVAPLARGPGYLHVAVADPSDPLIVERLSVATGLAISVTVAPKTSIAAILAKARSASSFGSAGSGEEASGDLDDHEALAGELDAITDEALANEQFPVARLVNTLLFAGVKEGASDIHVEPRSDGVQVKFRLDGVLVKRLSRLRSSLLPSLIGRIKVLARLDVAETRVPQDGRFRVWVAGREVDFRVAVLPTILGESAVLRILDRKSTLLSLATLGFEPEELGRFRAQVRAPYGMVLVSGPTGSGKTTTLYAAIRDVYREEDKWITIEEPVEYLLDGVMQIPVNPRKGVTFASGLRAIVRQDPDRLMVGEIRDRETAEIAVNAAMTGHLVLSTVHANNVIDTIGRLRHLGLEPYQIASALSLVMAQRLLRKLCPDCKRRCDADDRALSEMQVDGGCLEGGQVFIATGCIRCGGTGYRGRRPIFEMLVLNDEIREHVLAGDSLLRIRELARHAGMKELRDCALACVRAGETSLDEMTRVTRE